MYSNKFFRCKSGKDKGTIYEQLYTFKSEETQKNYIFYTDNKFDSKGNLRILVGIYNPNDEELDILPIETRSEWEIVKREWRKQLFAT